MKSHETERAATSETEHDTGGDKILLNLGDLYHRSKNAARAAVLSAPLSTYGLQDIESEEVLLSAFDSSMAGPILLNGTFAGCISALRARETALSSVSVLELSPPEDSAVRAEDMGLAKNWLLRALAENLNDRESEKMMQTVITERGWDEYQGRLSSLVLALVMTAGQAADHASR